MRPHTSRARARHQTVRDVGRLPAGAASPRCLGSMRTPSEHAAGRSAFVATRRALRSLPCARRLRAVVERAGLQARLRGGQRALATPRRVPRQRDGALQERGRGGDPAARLRPTRRTLELEGDLFVGLRRRRGQMPGPAVRVELPIGRLGQCQVDRPPLLHRRRSDRWRTAPADGGRSPGHRSSAAHPPRHPRPPGRRRAVQPRARAGPDPERLCRREQRQPRRVVGERARVDGRSCPRSAPGAHALRGSRSRRRARSRSTRAAARAGPAGCHVSRRRSDRAPARPA